MPTTLTRQKIAEARFFLEKLEAPTTTCPDFNYHLSAFVSAARSVTWVLKAENNGDPAYRAWDAATQPTGDEKAFLRLFNDIRIRSEKTEPLRAVPVLTSGLATHPVESMQESAKVSQVKSLVMKSESGHTITLNLPSDPTQGVERKLREFPNDEVSAACRKYLELVESWVGRWECNAT